MIYENCTDSTPTPVNGKPKCNVCNLKTLCGYKS